MFISKYEKEEMRISIRTLQAEVKSLNDHLERLAKYVITKDAPKVKKRQGPQWDQAKKLAASERMKKHWAERKARKEAA